MVFIQDLGSHFDAPIERVWEYIFGGYEHDKVHTSTRGGKISLVSKSPLVLRYTSERRYGRRWVPEAMRISIYPPVATVQEFLKGPLAGSVWTYVYTPKGKRTRIDVVGEFKSKSFGDAQLRRVATAFLDNEFREDAPAVRRAGKSKKE